MSQRTVTRNAIFSVVQIAVVSVTLFVLYRYLLVRLGPERIGVWAIVLSTTSISRMAGLGLSGSLVKFVAKYVALNERAKASVAIQTALISSSVLAALFLSAAYPLAVMFFKLILPLEAFQEVRTLLPHSFISLWLMTVGSVTLSAIDGLQRIVWRASIIMAASVFNLIVSVVLVRQFEVVGLAYARIAQYVVLSLGSWFVLRGLFKGLPIVPLRFSMAAFREMFSYSVNFQMISLSQMLYEPLTKSLLGRFGGLSMVGYYEMASKLIVQLQGLIAAANRVLVPEVARLQELSPERIRHYYARSFASNRFFSVLVFMGGVLLLPVVSVVWIGSYQSVFVFSGLVLSVAWFINTMSFSAYFFNLGTGELRWNVIAHIAIAVLNLVAGYLLGSVIGGRGVILGWVVALSGGSGAIVISYHTVKGIPLGRSIGRNETSILVLFALCLLYLGFLEAIGYHQFSYVLHVLLPLILLLAGSVFAWRHPLRGEVSSRIKRLVGGEDA